LGLSPADLVSEALGDMFDTVYRQIVEDPLDLARERRRWNRYD
jgi:hypothetical protein